MYICTRVAERRTPELTCWRRQSFAVFLISCQGYPTTVFCELSVRRSKYCLEFSSWGLLEISGWPFHTGTIFEAYFINPHYNFLKFNFSHFTRHAGLIFARNPKIFLFKNVMESGLRKNLIFVKRQIASKTFGKLIRYDTTLYFRWILCLACIFHFINFAYYWTMNNTILQFRQGCHNSDEPITVVPDTNTEQIQI